MSGALPQARLHHASAIRADPALAQTITAFVNQGYRHIAPEDALRWNATSDDRLPTAQSIHEELGEDGMFAVMYDNSDGLTPIACAATKRWKGDLEGYAAEGEEGWEIKTVTTREEWMRRGLAGRCVEKLVEELVKQARNDEKRGGGRKLQVWVQAVEDVNGAYWKKKGWIDVRSYAKPVGHWGSKVGYCLLVLLQEYSLS